MASAFKTFQDASQHNETSVYVNALLVAASMQVRSMWDWLSNATHANETSSPHVVEQCDHHGAHETRQGFAYDVGGKDDSDDNDGNDDNDDNGKQQLCHTPLYTRFLLALPRSAHLACVAIAIVAIREGVMLKMVQAEIDKIYTLET